MSDRIIETQLDEHRPKYRRFWGPYQKGLTQVWVTTGGKDHWTLVPRWRLLFAVFAKDEVWL